MPLWSSEKFDLLVAFVRTQDEAERRLLAGFQFVLLQPAQVQFHLPLVPRLEFAELQVHGDEAAEFAVIECRPRRGDLGVDGDPLRRATKQKPGPEFEHEPPDLADRGSIGLSS